VPQVARDQSVEYEAIAEQETAIEVVELGNPVRLALQVE
jgi:hypothetical protein